MLTFTSAGYPSARPSPKASSPFTQSPPQSCLIQPIFIAPPYCTEVPHYEQLAVYASPCTIVWSDRVRRWRWSNYTYFKRHWGPISLQRSLLSALQLCSLQYCQGFLLNGSTWFAYLGLCLTLSFWRWRDLRSGWSARRLFRREAWALTYCYWKWILC